MGSTMSTASGRNAGRNAFRALLLVFFGVLLAGSWFYFRQYGTEIVRPNEPVQLVQFKTVKDGTGQDIVQFVVARDLSDRGRSLLNSGLVKAPKVFTKIDGSLPVNTLVYTVTEYEGRELALYRYHPRVVVTARSNTRLAPDPSMNLAQRIQR